MTKEEKDSNGWAEYKNLILAALKENNNEHKEVKKLVQVIADNAVLMRIDIASLQVKSSIFGFIGGAIPSSTLLILFTIS